MAMFRRISDVCASEMPAASRRQRFALAIRLPASSQGSGKGEMEISCRLRFGSLAKVDRSRAYVRDAEVCAAGKNTRRHVRFPTQLLCIRMQTRNRVGLATAYRATSAWLAL